MRECFGQTELVATLCTFPWMKICPGSMGKPAPIFDVDLVDENDESCAPGHVGEIVLRTGETNPPGMFMGYYKDEEMTRSVWHDGIYHTGDLAWRDEWGYYWYVGRADDVIKSSGYRIGPFEVLYVYLLAPGGAGVRDNRSARPGARSGRQGHDSADPRLQGQGRRRSGQGAAEPRKARDRSLQVSAHNRVVETLPKTISGKIRRVELREKDMRKQ